LDEFIKRIAVARKIADRLWVKIVLGIWAVIAFYDTLVSQFFPDSWAKKAPKMRELIAETSGWLSWWEWLLILAGIISVACFEYAVRKTAPRPEATAVKARNDIPDVRVADEPLVLALFENSERDKLLPLLEAGKIDAWARSGYDSPPLTKIPSVEWRTYFLAFLPQRQAGTINQTFFRIKARPTESTYFDIHLNRAQLTQVWPRLWDSLSIDRIGCTELLKIATTDGWDFYSPQSLHLLDLQEAMRQGGMDGTLTIWGKENKWSSENLMRQEVIVKIPADHWKDHLVHLFAARENDNFNTYSWSPTSKPFGRHVYVDLHVERSQATSWLRRDALSFKGKKKQ
jgi:hypothetical protein